MKIYIFPREKLKSSDIQIYLKITTIYIQISMNLST